MLGKIEYRNVKLTDAKRLLEIVQHPDFKYFLPAPADLDAEKAIIRQMQAKQKQKLGFYFVILCNQKTIGSCNISIAHEKHCCNLGYFIDRDYWGRGIATQSVKMLETKAFNELSIIRAQLIMDIRNKPSLKVAIKNNYKKEGILKKYMTGRTGLQDFYMYAKINKNAL